MTHIHTTATAIKKIKLLGKQISAATGIKLTEALDAAALASGYVDYHHAISCHAKTAQSPKNSILNGMRFYEVPEYRDWNTYASDGTQLATINSNSGKFVTDHHLKIIDANKAMTDLIFSELCNDDIEVAQLSKRDLSKIVKACNKTTKLLPTYVDGYAYCAEALNALNEYEQSIAIARPVYDELVAMVPVTFTGFVPFEYRKNQPFYRLAQNLCDAYDSLNDTVNTNAIVTKAGQLNPNLSARPWLAH